MASSNDVRTMTAPLAIIKNKDGISIGKIKNIKVSESYQRGNVTGLGVIVSSEKPILMINCTFTASSYFIDLTKFGSADNPFLTRVKGGSLADFLNTLLLQDMGVNLYLYRLGGTIDSTSKLGILGDPTLIGVIGNAFLESYSFDISEGQISGSELSGSYLEPMTTTGA